MEINCSEILNDEEKTIILQHRFSKLREIIENIFDSKRKMFNINKYFLLKDFIDLGFEFPDLV